MFLLCSETGPFGKDQMIHFFGVDLKIVWMWIFFDDTIQAMEASFFLAFEAMRSDSHGSSSCVTGIFSGIFIDITI